MQLVTELGHRGLSLALDVIQKIGVFLPVIIVITLHDFFIEQDEILILIQILEEL